jgi:H+-transporting ATPase
MEGVVIATGGGTFFGRTAKLVADAGAVSHAQKAMFEIGNLLIAVALIFASAMVGVSVYRDVVVSHTWGAALLDILQFVLILLIASIPVAMPAVFSITMALGALALSKEKAIVSRLSAIEEMAGVDVLCSDKTGTLTKKELTLGEPIVLVGKDAQDCIIAAALASKIEDRDAIDTAVVNVLKDKDDLKKFKVQRIIPFDPVTKRTEAVVTDEAEKSWRVAKGAPQAIANLAEPPADIADKIKRTVGDLAGRGFRAPAIARSEDDGKSWSLLRDGEGCAGEEGHRRRHGD